MTEHRNGKKNKWWRSIFFLSWDYALNQHHTIGYHTCFYSCSFMIATHGQKTLHWQLNKVILSGMYNCNSEARD